MSQLCAEVIWQSSHPQKLSNYLHFIVQYNFICYTDKEEPYSICSNSISYWIDVCGICYCLWQMWKENWLECENDFLNPHKMHWAVLNKMHQSASLTHSPSADKVYIKADEFDQQTLGALFWNTSHLKGAATTAEQSSLLYCDARLFSPRVWMWQWSADLIVYLKGSEICFSMEWVIDINGFHFSRTSLKQPCASYL